MIMFYTVVIK